MNTRIRVWDLPTRVFHWSLAASFAVAFITHESERLAAIHVGAGYTFAGLLVFRLLWGFVGGRHARFADFWPSAEKLVAYLRALWRGHPPHYLGHNPAGALAIFALLGLGLVTTASGWLAYQDIGGEWLEEVHETAANGMMLLVGIHLLGVIASSWLHRENLVGSMITGYKTTTAHENPPA